MKAAPVVPQTDRPAEPGVEPVSLVLTSAWVDGRLRADVRQRVRPLPEYLVLEARHGATLLDWSQVRGSRRHRSIRQSFRHIGRALPLLKKCDVVFSDGEHLAIPLALAMRCLRISKPHLVIGHHLTAPRKRALTRWLGSSEAVSRILVHSTRQLSLLERELRVPSARLRFVPYGVDTDFWRPLPIPEEPLIVSAGREHRDYLTLARAGAGLSERIFVADASLHSPEATRRGIEQLPPNVQCGFADYPSLRAWYARAQVVAVPLIENDFQAGVTTILEAMAAGKAVVVSGTAGQRDVVEDGVTGVLVPPGDAGELRRAIRHLLDRPHERARLGANARAAAIASFGVQTLAGRLAHHMREIAGSAG